MRTTPATLSVSSTKGAVSAAVHRDANSGPPSRATTSPHPSFASADSTVAATAPQTSAPSTSDIGSRSYRSRR